MKHLTKTLPAAAAVGAFSLLPATSFAAPAGTQPAKPNIIFILADDAGYGDVGFTGQKRFSTPNIDKFAREGMTMTQHYAGVPVCAPSRATLMTGLHTGHVSIRGNHGYVGNSDYTTRIPLARTDLTIAERLKDLGYATGLAGKWGLGEPDTQSAPWLRGWDFFYGFVNQANAHNQYPEALYRNSVLEPLTRNFSHEEKTFANDRFTAEGLAFIERNAGAGQPFFLYMAYTTPHSDLKCPPDTIAQLKREQAWARDPGADPEKVMFAAMMMRLDRDVGRIMDKLKQLGIDENTLVIFTSDNGPHAECDKGCAFFDSAAGLRGIKRDMYEGGIREPFAARWPGRIKAGSTSDHLAAFWDFTPTVLDILGAPAPENLDGISYAPTLLGSPEKQKQHDYLYWELLVQKQGRQAIRQGNLKAVRNGVKNAIELYDLSTDPAEQNNIAAKHPDKVRHFEKLMREARTDSTIFPLELKPGQKTVAANDPFDP